MAILFCSVEPCKLLETIGSLELHSFAEFATLHWPEFEPNLKHAIERVERPGGSHEGVGRKKNWKV